MWYDDSDLSIHRYRRATDEWLIEQHTAVVDEVPRLDVVCGVDYKIILCNDALCVVRCELARQRSAGYSGVDGVHPSHC